MALTSKKWMIATVGLTIFFLASLGSITVIIDPYFHYRAPLSQLEYPITNERYQNDGIVKHFSYDAIITGTSMTQNFKASEMDELFHANSIKVPLSGGGFKETNELLERAVQANPNISCIVRGLDHALLILDKDWMRYDVEFYPNYLYDNFLPNDVNYILNKEILGFSISVLQYTKSGGKTTDFDAYGNWMSQVTFGKAAVTTLYQRPVKTEMKEFTEADRQMVKSNVQQNVVELVEDNPNIEFYLFFPPYSIYMWDAWKQSGDLERQLEAEKLEIELLLEHENVKLFSFFQNYEMICNLDNYKDHTHYSEEINSKILQWMSKGTYQLTKENYLDYCDDVRNFYYNYDYDALFVQ